MTSIINKRVVSTLYKNILKAARVYGEVAEMKQMAAIEEIASFNKDLKMQTITTRNSLNRGVMTSDLAQFMARSLFQSARTASSQDFQYYLGDALTAYKKLNQKAAIYNQLPEHFHSEQVVNGIKIEARSRFVGHLPGSGKYRYQLSVRFTNQTSNTLQLLSENLYTKDEQLNESNRESGLIPLQKKIPAPLSSSGVYEHTTLFSLPTELGFCSCEYLFADQQTGTPIRVPIAPLLLSTHDPDTDYRKSCYRGDPSEDIKVVTRVYKPEEVEKKTEVIDQSPPERDAGEGKEWMRLEADNDERLTRGRPIRVVERTGWKQPVRRSLDFQDLDHAESPNYDQVELHRGG